MLKFIPFCSILKYENVFNLGGVFLLIQELAKGQKIELDVRFESQTINFQSEIILARTNDILISKLTVNEQTIGFSEKCQINFLCNIEEKLFQWENVTVKLVKYDGVVYHKIDLEGEGKPFNRRESYRLYIGEDMQLLVNKPTGPTSISVLIKDISENGVGFVTAVDIDLERTVRLKLKDSNFTLSLPGIVVRKEFKDNINCYMYGCRFSEKNQTLGKYIMKKQAERQRKKALNPTHSKE